MVRSPPETLKKQKCTHTGDHRARDTHANTRTLALCEPGTHDTGFKHTVWGAQQHYVFTYCMCVGSALVSRHVLKQRHSFAWACAEFNRLTLTRWLENIVHIVQLQKTGSENNFTRRERLLINLRIFKAAGSTPSKEAYVREKERRESRREKKSDCQGEKKHHSENF